MSWDGPRARWRGERPEPEPRGVDELNHERAYLDAAYARVDMVTRRGEFCRVIACELNRIASHLISVGTFGQDIGAMTPLFYTFRDREEILKIFEKYCGARLTLNCMRIGRLPFDLTPGWTERLSEFVDDPPARIDVREFVRASRRHIGATALSHGPPRRAPAGPRHGQLRA